MPYIASFITFILLTLSFLPAASSARVTEGGGCKLFPANDTENCESGSICEPEGDSTTDGVCRKAGSTQLEYGLGTESDFEKVGIKTDTGVKSLVGQIINIILGFLGVIAVIIILAGGFKWMTAAGNEDKVGEARKMIVQGVIGLVVIFAAWAIAAFVINQLTRATT